MLQRGSKEKTNKVPLKINTIMAKIKKLERLEGTG